MVTVGRFALIVALAAGCSKKDASSADAPRDPVASGEQIYAEMCKSCHGARGEGGKGPSLRDEKKAQPDLAAFIDAQMPLGDPDKCRGQCAQDVAAYILATFKGPIVCTAPTPAARGLRLLTRREYRNTVTDLFGSPPPASCAPTTFTYDPKGRTLKTVHVAGSFNGWPQTIAAGGWPLALSGATWTLTRQLPQGQSTYKLVLDESEWIADPSNPNTVPDGFGGQNSVLNVACSPGGAAPDVTLGFPPETRPEGFPFDDDGQGRVVTSVLASEYLKAGLAVAASIDTTKLVTCDFASGTCAEDTVRALGKRIFRRPLAPAEVTRYRDLAKGQGDAAKGTRAAVAAMLASPGFLYRSELGEKQPDGTYRLTQWEVATALSYIFWATTPDDALLGAAERGELATTDQIEAQARRLLASPRARDVIGVFTAQWLGAENVTTVDKNDPAFDATLRGALLEETQRFVEDVVFDGSHRADDLFVANYTFLNQRLAQHYGIAGVTGDAMQKVTYPDARRAGVLGHGSVLAATGLSDQSSPIRRGLFVRRRLLCQDFPPPPPNAGGVPKVDPNATTRDRFFQHTANPFCHSCHQYIDPVGFGFEHFDTFGKWRDLEAGKPIDASGDMNDVEGLGTGTHAPFASLPDLGRTLAASDAAKTCLVRQYYRFARGRLDDDICDSAPMKARLMDKGGDLRELLVGVVTAPDFGVRR